MLPFAAAILLSLYLVLSAGPARSVLSKCGAVALGVLLASLIMFWQSRIPEPPENQLACGICRAQVLARLGYFEGAAREILALLPPRAVVDSATGSAP
jgi:hypothetical protein